VHVVTIREAGEDVFFTGGHAVHQMGKESVQSRPTVHVVHQIGAGDALDGRYGHVVHT
jgi:hypothetical protein